MRAPLGDYPDLRLEYIRDLQLETSRVCKRVHVLGAWITGEEIQKLQYGALMGFSTSGLMYDMITRNTIIGDTINNSDHPGMYVLIPSDLKPGALVIISADQNRGKGRN